MIPLKPIKKRHTKVNMGGQLGKVQYIVIHFVGAAGQALDNAVYFEHADRGASAHYFVDSKEIYEVVPDNRVAWHVGDGRGKFGITNYNSIGIEGCQDTSTGRNAWEWQFHPETYKQMIALTIHLMKKHGVPIERVVRHYDASRKLCPGNWAPNNWAKWHQFKKDLQAELNGQNVTVSSPAPKPVPSSEAKGSQGAERYTIQTGDTLSKIAKAHKVSVSDLVKWNQIPNPNLIVPGTKLRLNESKVSGIQKQGSFRFNTTVNVRTKPSVKSEKVAEYYNQEVVLYDDVIEAEGLIWLKYRSNNGKDYYVSAGSKTEPFGKFL